jgi:FkbM family methyltransferase
MKQFVTRLAGLFGEPRIPTVPDVYSASVRLGSAYGGWAIDPRGLNRSSVVYSFGVGEDISFDLELIERFGATVHAFDPTPRSIEWVAGQSLPVEFHFHPHGIASYDGTATFFPPENPAHVSHTMLDKPATAGRRVDLPVKRLDTIMRELGHDRLDILKMDIEGAEYAVVDDIVSMRVPISQLLVEYHHRFDGVGAGRTAQSIRRLQRAGYRLFNISESAEEYSFLGAGRRD